MTGFAVQSMTEQDLITCAQRGDRYAFGELVRLYRERVVNVVYRMCGDMPLAEEAAQEAFLRAWQNLHRYQSRFAFRSWIYRIALNAATDMLRRERDTVDIDALPLEADVDAPEKALERKERTDAVRRAVLALPDSCRAALILREYEVLSYQEIAGILDIPVGTVMSRLNYARQQLRAMLAQYLEMA